jgi:hypothetical protein
MLVTDVWITLLVFSIDPISSILVSQRYVHPTPERVEEAVFRLDEYNRKKAEELKAKERIS